MKDCEQIKKISKKLSAVVTFIILLFLGFWVYNAVQLVNNLSYSYTGINLLLNSSLSVLSLLILFCVLFLLRSIFKERTPFTKKNVKYLKVISILLIIFEPLQMFISWIGNKFFPIILDNSIKITSFTTLGGILLITGIGVFCIALVFEYGVILQTQSDETL